MSDKNPDTTLERDRNHMTIMPIQASLNPSPNYRRPAIEIIEALSSAQLKELLRVNKDNKEFVKDLKFFHQFNRYPQDKLNDFFTHDLTLDKRLQTVLTKASETIPPELLASQANNQPSILDKLLSAIFKPNAAVVGKGPKPTLTNAPSPFNSSGGETEEEKKKKKKNEYSSPSPT